jgi:C1A family cysteine protease
MIQSIELTVSYGSNPVHTVSDILSQTDINNLSLGQNNVRIPSQSMINILNNADSNVDHSPLLKITYVNGTSSVVSGTIYNDPPEESIFGWKQGEIHETLQHKSPSQSAINLALATNFYLVPLLNLVPVYNQYNLGSCTSNTLAFCFEYCQRKQHLQVYNSQVPFNPPSRLFIYYNERNYEGSLASDAGAQIYDGIKCLNEIGVCSEDLWPYTINKFATAPDTICYTQASQNIALTFNAIQTPMPAISNLKPEVIQSILGIQAALVSGYPVTCSIKLFPFMTYGMDIQSNPLCILQCPDNPIGSNTLNTSIGGHAITIVGFYNDLQTAYGTGVFFARNSWGTNWGFNLGGSRGYFCIPYQYFTNSYYYTNGNRTILVYDLWNITTVATNNVTIGQTQGYGQLQFSKPNSVAADLSGNYVVADTYNNRIQVVSPSGQFIRFIGNLGVDLSGNPISGSGNCQFNLPHGVAVDLSGNYVVADTYNHRIQVISSSGVFIRNIGYYATTGNGNFKAPNGVAIDLSGNYIVADSGNDLIQVISPLGVFQRQFSSYTNLSQSNNPINFNNPKAVAIDLSGNYVVVNTDSNRVVVISPLGNFIRQFGSGGSMVGDGTLNYPTGVAVDLSGNYLVADSLNNLIQIFTPSGAFHSELGSISLKSIVSSIPGPFNSPQGVAIDKTGKYIIADSDYNRIMAFNI